MVIGNYIRTFFNERRKKKVWDPTWKKLWGRDENSKENYRMKMPKKTPEISNLCYFCKFQTLLVSLVIFFVINKKNRCYMYG
jgi:hypothetical protein